jgi:hypothetical protein
MQILALDANANGSESLATWDCESEDGMGACPVDVQLADGGLTSFGAIEAPVIQFAATEETEAPVPQALATEVPATEEPAAPMIQAIDAIIAAVTQPVTIVVPEDAGVTEEPAQTGSISEPLATEPVLVADEKTAPEAAAAPRIEAADAIEVEVTQSVTVAVAVAAPGPDVAASDEPAYTGPVAGRSTTDPVSNFDAASSDDLE